MTDEIRLTDRVGVVGIDATDYGDFADHKTTIETDLLKQGIELLETLGWEQVDVCTVEDTGTADHPLLVLAPPHESLLSGDQAGIAITPVTEKGREVNDD